MYDEPVDNSTYDSVSKFKKLYPNAIEIIVVEPEPVSDNNDGSRTKIYWNFYLFPDGKLFQLFKRSTLGGEIWVSRPVTPDNCNSKIRSLSGSFYAKHKISYAKHKISTDLDEFRNQQSV